MEEEAFQEDLDWAEEDDDPLLQQEKG